MKDNSNAAGLRCGDMQCSVLQQCAAAVCCRLDQIAHKLQFQDSCGGHQGLEWFGGVGGALWRWVCAAQVHPNRRCRLQNYA